LDLGGFLAVYGTAIDGNPLSLNPGYSIGGPAPANDPIAGNSAGLVSLPQGLSGSHNKYEGDTSPTRGDQYLVGNSYLLQVNQFQQYYDALPGNLGSDAQYEAIFPFRKARFQDSVNRNPYFFFPQFAGVLVAPAGYSFPKAMMANHSEEFVNGNLDKETFKSFFAITGKSGSFKYNAGYERIPENWYRRPIGDDFSIPDFLVDVLDYGAQDPQLLIPGGNTGTTNSYTPVNLTALTKGVYNGADIAKGNNLECLVYQTIQTETPDILKNEFTNLVTALAPLNSLLNKQISALGCPKLQGIDNSQYSKYPGYTKSGGAV